MQFPEWVDKPRSQKARNANRLRYLIRFLALQIDKKASMQNVADQVGLTHATVSGYVRQGYFSQKCANLFEQTFGKKLCAAQWLVDPTTIPTK